FLKHVLPKYTLNPSASKSLFAFSTSPRFAGLEGATIPIVSPVLKRFPFFMISLSQRCCVSFKYTKQKERNQLYRLKDKYIILRPKIVGSSFNSVQKDI